MTVTLCVALLILGVSALLMRIRYREQWVLRPFSMLVIAALLYHRASEVVMRFAGSAVLGTGRPVDRWADEGALVTATALLAMTIGYLVAYPARHIQRMQSEASWLRRVRSTREDRGCPGAS